MVTARAPVEVVVVGGGVVGCSAALYLAHAGVPCVLLEKRRPGWAASGRNAGAIRRHGRHHTELPLAVESMELWEAFAAESAVDFHFTRGGDLVVAFTEVEAERLAASAAAYREMGLDVRLLDQAAASEVAPGLSTDVRAASHCPDDAMAYPILATRALAAAAVAAGAEVRSHCEVVGVVTAAGRVAGVRYTTADGAEHELQAGCVVNATGPWAGAVSAMAGSHAAVAPRRSQMLVTDRTAPWLSPFVAGNGIYVRQSPYGNVMVGGGGRWEEVGHTTRGTATTLQRLSARFLRIFPKMAHLQVLRGWAGSVEITPDHRPLLGLDPRVPGLIVAAGFCGNGFALGPVAGRVVADLVTRGGSRHDLRPFRPDRFPRELDPAVDLRARHAAAQEPIL